MSLALPERTRLASSAVQLTRELIAIDSSNIPDGPGERAAAALVADALRSAGGAPSVLAGSPGRDNVVLRIPGRSPGPGLVVHAHLDTVPPEADRWSVDPWGAQVRDGCIWGVGAVDMKSAAAMMLAVAVEWLSLDEQPEHDVVFAFVADEESGGTWGARWLVREHPHLFAGCDTAVGEVGGFAIPLRPGTTLYPVMTAERGHAVVELEARAGGGHSGAAGAAGNALTILAGAVAALGSHSFQRFPTVAAEDFVAAAARIFGLPPALAHRALGGLAGVVEPGLRGSAVPTVLHAGRAPNVSPGRATAIVDCRFVPGHWDQFWAEFRAILPDGIQTGLTMLSPGSDGRLDGRVVAAMTDAVRRADPSAVLAPYGVAASTDGPAFASIGLRPFGFTPLGLPAGFPYAQLFHGVDERVPIAAVEFGARVLADFLACV